MTETLDRGDGRFPQNSSTSGPAAPEPAASLIDALLGTSATKAAASCEPCMGADIDTDESEPVEPAWLSAGGRPNESALALLRQAASDRRRCGDPSASRGALDDLSAAAALRLCSGLLERARAKGPIALDEARALLKPLESLPVFFSERFCAIWEHEKPWMEFGLHPREAAAYAELLDSQRPSSAYAFGSADALAPFLTLAARGPAEVLPKILEHSAGLMSEARLSEAASSNPPSAPLAPILACARALGLSDAHARSWAAWRLFTDPSSPLGALASLASGAHSGSLLPAFADACSALGMPRSEAALIEDPVFGPERLGLRGSLAKPARLPDGSIDGDALSPDPASLRLDLLPESAGGLPPALAPVDAEPRGSWHWLPEFSMAASGLRSGGSLLVQGPAGSGKTDCALACAAAAGRKAVRAPEGSGSEGLAKALRWAGALGWIVVERRDALDGAAEALKVARSCGAALVWLSCDPAAESFGGASRGAARFDFHASLGDLPPAERRACAASLFKDPDTAKRAAAALRLPGEMAALARALRLSGDESWDAALGWIRTRTRGIEGAKRRGERGGLVEAAEPKERISGCPELTELLERAARAIDEPGTASFRGALLMGPPGTGKTLFARTLAARCQARVLAPNSSLLAEDPERIVRAFDAARAMAPCILVLDEADALVADPIGPFGSVDRDGQAAVNALIGQLDGVEPLEGVFVVATSHREFRPDPAVVRSGRLSEVLRIPLPERAGRAEIWAEMLGARSGKGPLPEADLAELARASSGFSGAEIKEAVARARERIAPAEPGLSGLLAECDRMFWGQASNRPLSEDERLMTAIHEAGHAFAAWGSGLDVVRACARPGTSGFLGMVHFEPEDDRASMTPSEWRGRIAVCLAGIGAEKALAGHYTNGGGSDLRSAHNLIQSALLNWGWSSFGPSAIFPKDASDKLKAAIEEESAEISRRIFAKTVAWLSDRADAVSAFAAELRDRREISGPDLDAWKARALEAGPLAIEADQGEGASSDGHPFAAAQAWDERPFGGATLHRGTRPERSRD